MQGLGWITIRAVGSRRWARRRGLRRRVGRLGYVIGVGEYREDLWKEAGLYLKDDGLADLTVTFHEAYEDVISRL